MISPWSTDARGWPRTSLRRCVGTGELVFEAVVRAAFAWQRRRATAFPSLSTPAAHGRRRLLPGSERACRLRLAHVAPRAWPRGAHGGVAATSELNYSPRSARSVRTRASPVAGLTARGSTSWPSRFARRASFSRSSSGRRPEGGYELIAEYAAGGWPVRRAWLPALALVRETDEPPAAGPGRERGPRGSFPGGRGARICRADGRVRPRPRRGGRAGGALSRRSRTASAC